MGVPKKILILQHVPNENAGTILDFLRENEIPHLSVPLFESGYSLPSLDSVRSLVVMGGPMNVYEENKYLFLREEDRYIREAVKKRIPYLGVCLGSQLLAKALDARVYKAPQEEVGWDTVHLSPEAAADPLFGTLGSKDLKVLQWHGDTFDLPERAVHLASSAVVPNQAYSVDGLFYGLQFHVEVDRPMLEDWFKNRADLPQILGEFDAYRLQLSAMTKKFYAAFFSLSKPQFSRV